MSLLIGVPRETFAGEKRVATVPDVVEKLKKLGFGVLVESGAGDLANFGDDTYRAAGAEVVPDAAPLWAKADIVFEVRAPSMDEVARISEGTTLVSFIWPAQNPELMQQLAAYPARLPLPSHVVFLARQTLSAWILPGTCMARYECFKLNISLEHLMSWFYRGCWHQPCLRLILRTL